MKREVGSSVGEGAGAGTGATGALVISTSGSVGPVVPGDAVVSTIAAGIAVLPSAVGPGELVGKGVVGSGLGTLLG